MHTRFSGAFAPCPVTNLVCKYVIGKTVTFLLTDWSALPPSPGNYRLRAVAFQQNLGNVYVASC